MIHFINSHSAHNFSADTVAPQTSQHNFNFASESKTSDDFKFTTIGF